MWWSVPRNVGASERHTSPGFASAWTTRAMAWDEPLVMARLPGSHAVGPPRPRASAPSSARSSGLPPTLPYWSATAIGRLVAQRLLGGRGEPGGREKRRVRHPVGERDDVRRDCTRPGRPGVRAHARVETVRSPGELASPPPSSRPDACRALAPPSLAPLRNVLDARRRPQPYQTPAEIASTRGVTADQAPRIRSCSRRSRLVGRPSPGSRTTAGRGRRARGGGGGERSS